ncbi:nuclear transport factor 2 family protein [Haloferax sp. DFSO52]|uniref:nuclear transport factor 2 family protein n=1 Tax=Haloferax sp. DFSO52 TaxID=3388505 RepID=UPI003A8A5166
MAAIGKETNVELLQSAYDAYNKGDLDTVLSVFADDIEWVEPEGAPSPGTHIGPDAILNDIFMETMATFEDLSVEPDRIIDGGDTVVGVGRFRGTHRESGKQFDVSFAHVCDMKDGKMTKCINNTDTAAMLSVLEA